MPRDYSKVNLDIWNDQSFRGLPVDAQHLYMTLWTHPELSYAGTLDWRPKRTLGFASDWTPERLDAALNCLLARHFVVVDDLTEEILVRSFIRYDGLMKQPILAASCEKAIASIGSTLIRSVVAHELQRMHAEYPEMAGWNKPQVAAILEWQGVDPRSLDVPDDPFNPPAKGSAKGSANPPAKGSANPYGHPEANPPAKGSAKTPPTSASTSTSVCGSSGGKPTHAQHKRSIPDDWTPTPSHAQKAKELELDLESEAEDFVNDRKAKGVKYVDWDSAFHNWLKNARKFAERDGRVVPLRPQKKSRPTYDQITMGYLYQ